MTRTYRLLVTTQIEGDAETVPTIAEMAEVIATWIQADGDGIDSRVSPIEWQDAPHAELARPRDLNVVATPPEQPGERCAQCGEVRADVERRAIGDDLCRRCWRSGLEHGHRHWLHQDADGNADAVHGCPLCLHD